MDARRTTPSSSVRLSLRVDCIVRRDHPSANHRIQAIGGRSRDGQPWRLGEDAAIAAIDNERAAFYVEWPPGRRLNVVVAQGLGRRYLKTKIDRELPERLLALPDCE